MTIFEKLKKLLIAYIANNFKLSNKLTRVNHHLSAKLTEIEKTQQVLAQKLQNLEKQMHLKLSSLDFKTQALFRKSMENEILALRDSLLPQGNLPIRKNHFVLLSYNKHIPKYSHHNLGDFIQTIATKNALLSLNPKLTFEYFDRDSLIAYPAGGGANSHLNALTPVVMQGWFAFPDSPHFIPNHHLLPVFVGTHFTCEIQKFLQYFCVYYPWYFANKTIGCRDLATLESCQKLGLEAYLSRCLTLTLPKRTQEEANAATKVFLVGIPENLLEFIPQGLREGAISVNQQGVSNEQSLQWQRFYQRSEDLLETYKKEAKLVVTCALHCASPCIAMGIPVVLIARNEENLGRFSALSGIVPIWTLEDLKKGRVDFMPQTLNIESLKKDMLENLRLSIQQEMGESVDTESLQAIRQRIADFNLLSLANQSQAESQTASSTTSAGGGGNKLEAKGIKNTWKYDFKYDLEFKQRAQILLDLLSKEAKNHLKSVLDLGCGVQYFKEVLSENHLKVAYYGVDLYPHKPDNILCDFNCGDFPNFARDSFDLVVCAGLFEYIFDLPKFIERICSLSPKLILCSYNFINASEIDNKIWVKNRLKQGELFDLFLQNNYCLNAYKTHKRSLPTGYFLFCKKELMGKM